MSHEIPDRPWSKIATDLCHLNQPQYLILADYYSKFPEVILLNSTKAGPVIAAIKSIFARQGIPENVISDNGPPFDSSAFASFARNWEAVLVFLNPTDRLSVHLDSQKASEKCRACQGRSISYSS